MINSLSLHAGAVLKPALSPRLQRAVRLLQMSSQEFAQAVSAALETNPFLEQEQPQEAQEPAGEPETASVDPLPMESWAGDGLPRQGRREGDGEVFDTLEAPLSLADHLLGQLTVLPLSRRDFTLAAAVVESLEEDGYLRTPLAEVGQALHLLPTAQPHELTIAVRRVQALDP